MKFERAVEGKLDRRNDESKKEWNETLVLNSFVPLVAIAGEEL